MTQEQLTEILKKHELWLENQPDGERANLQGENLEGANLQRANLRWANLEGANLQRANLEGANLQRANLEGANLRWANLRWANLRWANLRWANLQRANLSGAIGVLSSVDFIAENFDRTDAGYIAYKTFGAQYDPPKTWDIEPGVEITETVNPDRCTECGCGINVAPLAWIKKHYPRAKPIWKVLIKWEWLPGVVVPFSTNGKIRCERVQLIEIVED